MRTSRCVLGLVLIVSLSLVGACQQAEPEATPTESAVPPAATVTQPSTEPTSAPTAGEAEAPAAVLAARDAVLAHLSERYGQDAPGSGLDWMEERATPEGLVGAETFRYTADDWTITVAYLVVAPEQVVYEVMVSNPSTAFAWQGEVNATGDVTEFAIAADSVLVARDAALAYVRERYVDSAPAADLTWTRERTTAEGIVGAETYEYRSGFWAVNISYPVVAPELVTYRIVISNESSGFQWQGEVDAQGTVTEVAVVISGQSVVAWYGQVVSLPPEAQFDDYLTLQPEGTGELGLTGADAAIESEIEALRDAAVYAHFWGTLACDVPDYGDCQLTVTRLRRDEPGALFDPDAVEAWQGIIVSTPEGAQFDDCFVLAGDFPVRYGVDSTDSALAAQIEGLRDTGTTVRLWGSLTAGIPDVNGAQIDVTAIELPSGPEPPSPMSVDGWVGVIVKLGADAQYDDYFERDDGERYGIDGKDEDMQKRIIALRTVAARIRIWGHLTLDVPDVEGRQIRVERFQLEPRSQAVDGWVGTIAALEPGAQYDDYFERDDGERYGIETADPKLAKRLEMLRAEGAQVKVWGELLSDVPDVGGRQIRVVEIEVVE
jgi:hypothetical protein